MVNKAFIEKVILCPNPFNGNKNLVVELSAKSLELLKEKIDQFNKDLLEKKFYKYTNLLTWDTIIYDFIEWKDDFGRSLPSKKILKQRMKTYCSDFFSKLTINNFPKKSEFFVYFNNNCSFPRYVAENAYRISLLAKKELEKINFYNKSIFSEVEKQNKYIKRDIILFNEAEIIKIKNFVDSFNLKLLDFYLDIHVPPDLFLAIRFDNYSFLTKKLKLTEKVEGDRFVSLEFYEQYEIELSDEIYKKFSSLYCGSPYISAKRDGTFFKIDDLKDMIKPIKNILNRSSITLKLLSYVSVCKAIYAGIKLISIVEMFHLSYDNYLGVIVELSNEISKKYEEIKN